MSASLTASRGEYRQGFGSVESDLDEVLALMRGTPLEREVIGGASEQDAREGLRAWFGAEDDEDAIVDTAQMITLSSEVPQSRGLPRKEGSNGRLSRSRNTRYGTRGPRSRADRNAKTSRHGLLAGDDGASHRRRPSS